MRKPRIKPNRGNNYLSVGYVIYRYCFALNRVPSFLCPNIKDCLPPTLRPMLMALNKLGADNKSIMATKVILETQYQGKYMDGETVWDTILEQRPYICRYPVVNFYGNYGSEFGDLPASPHFLEIELNKFGKALYAHSEKEWSVPIPYALINGHSNTISHIPPHNLNEVIDAVIMLIENPNATLEQLLTIVKGPDFHNGGEIKISYSDFYNLYETGMGDIKLAIDGKSRKLLLDFNFRIEDKIMSFGLKEILSHFIEHIRGEYTRLGGMNNRDDLIIEVLKNIKKDFGDARRTNVEVG